MAQDVDIDFTGARGSNTGDEFHELWVARECLRLLDSRSHLKAIKVEGVQSSDKSNVWESADCTLYYGGNSNTEAELVEIKQLKYSAANPKRSWTVARISSGKNGKPATSTLRGLAKAFSQLMAETQDNEPASISLALVTNQPISASLIRAIETARLEVPPNYVGAWKKGDPDLHRLIKASGLTSAEFHEFSKVLDLSGSTGSRFALEDSLLSAISGWTDAEFVEATGQLRTFVRNQMMPESAGEYIDRDRILVQLGVTDERALFPCPPKIKKVESLVDRNVVRTLADLLSAGTQRICLHGGGGVGKTTVLQQLERCLPQGSEMVVFDCYGGGSYLDASALRHRPQEAFVQLCNETATRLRLPLLLTHRENTNFAKAFRKRLDHAAKLISETNPKAILLVAIDAADNSVSAAQARGATEVSFIHDFMSFQELPNNVRFIVSARTGRLSDLKPPISFRKVSVEGFTPEETAENVQRYWKAPQNWIDEFHHLSNAIPRVQGYALEREASSLSETIEFLRPSGKDLSQVFAGIFDEALKKLGQGAELEWFCAGLIALPRPIPLSEIAAVLEISPEASRDICNDLAPGVTSQADFVGFADEDFEAFIRDSAKSKLDEAVRIVSERFLTRHPNHEYAAIHVAPLLKLSERHEDLLDLVERYPEPAAKVVTDPVVRQEVRTQRLNLAIRVCRAADDPERALRFILIGAEAKHTEAATRTLLAANPRLTAKYARDTGSRLILSDPESVEIQGPLLLNLMAEDAASGDFIAVREHRRRFRSWSQRRDDEYQQERRDDEHARAWDISAQDASCILYAELLERGAKAAIARHRHFRPLSFSTLSAKHLIQRLAEERRFQALEELAASLPALQSTFVLVPLVLAGCEVDHSRLEFGLGRLLRRVKLQPSMFQESYREDALGPYLADTLLTGAEILAANGSSNGVVRDVFAPFLDPEVRRVDKRNDHEVALLDAILRSVTLSHLIDGEQHDKLTVLFDRPPQENDQEKANQYDRNQHDEQLKELISAVTGSYFARAQILLGKIASDKVGEAFREGSRKLQADAWRFDRRYGFAAIRARAAESSSVLLMAQATKTDVIEAVWSIFGNQWLLNAPKLVSRLTPHPELHHSVYEKALAAAQATRLERIGAEEKSQNLAAFAHLLLPISPEDGQIFFQQSVEVAAELDSEAMDQIRLLDQLVSFGSNGIVEHRSDCAYSLSQIVEDAGVRLENVDHFPWYEAFSAISRLDASIALGCASRWQDRDIASLARALPPILHTATSNNQFSFRVSLALFIASESRDSRDLEKLFDAVDKSDSSDFVAEDIAQDLLLDRIAGSDCLYDYVSEFGKGAWTKKFKEYKEFKKSLPDAERLDREPRSTRTKDPLATLASHQWRRDELCNAELLKETANAVLKACRDNGESLSLGTVLESAREAVGIADRTLHLTALAKIRDTVQDYQIVDAIFAAANVWREQPAVSRWCKTELPSLIAKHLATISRYLPWEDKWIAASLELSGASDSDCQSILLEGIQENSEDLSAPVTFALAGVIASKLEADSAASLCRWYIDRLSSRIPKEYQEPVPKDAIPTSADEGIARFVFALLGDVDLRVRWRASHVIRRLARFGEGNLIENIWQQYNRTTEPVFRDPKMPFYWIAARLWLMIASDRISTEAPDEIAALGKQIFNVATCDKFPHVLVREYARDAASKLNSAGLLPLGESELDKLEKVNKSLLPLAEKGNSGQPSFDTLNQGEEERRFHFDGMDTLRYWYASWLRTFDGVSQDDFLRTAEDWIVDTWGINDEKPYGSKEPRTKRFTQRNWQLSTNGHGSLPTIEPHRTHLEWHAMWCTVGQLLTTHRLAAPRYEDQDDDELAYQIAYRKLTHPPIWLSDLVGIRPLQINRWRQPNPPSTEWFSNLDDGEFLSELLPADRPDYLVVHAHIDARWQRYRETVQISSALVSPKTAPALVRALQTLQSEYDYYLGPEDSDSDISKDGFKLKGWLQHPQGDPGFDDKDTFRNDVRQISMMPGKAVAKSLELALAYSPYPTWFRANKAEPSFLYEAWGEKETDDRERYYGDEVVSSGYRLLVRAEDLAEFLATEAFDLIAEVGVKRHERGERQRSYDTEDKTEVSFDRLLLLRGNGRIEGAERNFGSWRKDRQRAQG